MAIVTAQPRASREPPISERTVVGWMRQNLFSSVSNGMLTVVTLYIIYLTLNGLWTWGIVDAVWVADKPPRLLYDQC